MTTINQLVQEFERVCGPARKDDRMSLSLRGACLLAANEYEASFGPQDKDAVTVADDMFARLTRGG